MKSENPIDVIASAHDVQELLPADPTKAEATLTMVEQALAHPCKKPDHWSGPASYVFNYLRKRSPETEVVIVAAARDLKAGRI